MNAPAPIVHDRADDHATRAAAGVDSPAAARAPIVARPAWATIRTKILLAFLAVSLITGGLGAFALGGIGLTGQLVVKTYDNALMSISFARAAATNFAAIEALEARRRLVSEPARMAALAGERETQADDLRENLAVAAERALSENARLAAQKVERAVSDWLALAGSTPEPDENALARSAELDALSVTVHEQLDQLVNFVAGDGFLHRRRAMAAVEDTRNATLAGTLLALGLGAVIAVLLARRIIGPVAAASAAARQIASGQLDTDIPRAGGDELGILLGAMATMRDNIRAMVKREITQRRSAQARLVDAISTSRDGFVLVDPAGRVAIANAQAAAYFPEAAPALAPGGDVTVLVDAVGRGLIGPGPALALDPAETRLPDGRWLRISRSATQEGGFVATFSEITALKLHEAALRETNLRFDAALNNMSQGLCLYDSNSVLLVVNRRFCEIYRLDPDQIVPGISFRDLMGFSIAAGNHAGTDADALVARRVAFIAKREAATAFQELADGRVIAISHEPMSDGGWVVTYEDITERRRAEAQITHMARHDGLTGLPNRAQLRDRVAGAVAAGTPFAVLSIDIDDFRAVNETLGHPAGDAVLRMAAERMQEIAPEGSTVARLGGDEFAIVQSLLSGSDDAARLARRIIATLAEPFTVEDRTVALGGSIGIAMGVADGDTADALLTHADLARELARREGRGNSRFFEPGMDARQQKRRLIEADLRNALTNNDLQLYYQPLIEIASGRVTGFEALMRWRHPKRGMISPADFIPVAEELDLITPFGAWALRQACIDAATWDASGADAPRVAVNVSPVQFRKPGLVDAAREALRVSGLPPERLELEITESVLLDDSAATMEMLHRLRGLGLRIAMDDFGTGYSSLSTLRGFPFDKIKIDQSFIRDLGRKPDARSIVSAIAGLGRALGMRTTAEGVETEEQLAWLSAEGCTEAQGYLFSKPRPAEEIPALLRTLTLRRKAPQPAQDQAAQDQAAA